MLSMTRPPKHHRGLFLILLVSFICTFQVCLAADKDPFSLTDKNAGKINGPADVGYIDEDYEWGVANLGFMLNGHGLPDHRRTFVITHKSVEGKMELIWPVFDYGDNQANAEVLDHTLVFTAMLPDGKLILMAHRAGEPTMVISGAVLRLAAKRLGTEVIVPRTDYYFTKVRQPPDCIWLKGQPLSSAKAYPPAGVFTLELTVDDLRQVVADTRHRGKLYHSKKFDYFSEADPTHLSQQDAQEIGSPVPAPVAVPTIHKITQYRQKNDYLSGDVLLDSANQYAYFTVHHEPGRILKVALGHDRQTPPVVVGAAVLQGNEDNPFNALIDSQNGYAYYGTDFPGHVVKVALGVSNAPPYRVGSVPIDENWNVGTGMLDVANGYGYFLVSKRLYKIRLGKGDEPPSIVGYIEMPMEAGRGGLDPSTHSAYFTADRAILKVALGEGDAPPKFIGKAAFPDDDWGIRDAIVDAQSGYAWFTSQNARFIKISLGDKIGLPQRIGELKVASAYQYLQHTFGRENAGYAYLGTMGGGKTGDPQCCTGGVLKIALGKGDELPREASFMPLPDAWDITGGAVDSEQRVLYLGVTVPAVGCKVLKLSLGEGDAPPKILASTPLYPK
jgi:hypothetical protein